MQAFGANNPAMWKLLRSQGVFVGRGPAPKVAFLFTGQGSQYVNMLAELRSHEPIVRDDLRRGRPDHDPAAGQAAVGLRVRRRRGPRGRHAPQRPAAADRDHPARRADHRRRDGPAAGRLRDHPGPGHGPQPRRVRRPGRLRRAHLRRRPRGRQRPRPGDDPRLAGRQRRDGRRVRPAGRHRADRGRGRRLRRRGQHQLQHPGRHRRGDHRRRGRRGRVPGRRDDRDAHPGLARLPHPDRGRGQRAAEGRDAPPRGARAAACRSWPT